MSDAPVPGAPAWHPDPTGRHQLRWWDGSAFTDQVADGGTTTTDPGHGPAPAPAPAAGPAPANVPFNPALPSDVRGKKASRLPIILAAIGAFVVVLGMLVLLGGDDGGGGTGDFEGTVTEDEPGRHDVSIDGGSVLVVEVEPDDDLDVVVAFEVDDEDAEVIEELYEGTAFEEQAQAVDDEIFRRDVGFAGEDEVLFLAVAESVDVTVVLTGFDESEGDYEISIESFELDLPDDPDGDDVLDAVVENDDVPSSVQDEIEASLTEQD